MNPKFWFALLATALLAGNMPAGRSSAYAGEVTNTSEYRVLDPIRQGNLAVFPVVAAKAHDTSEFLTLDEGLRSGEVVATEYGNIPPLVRPRRQPPIWGPGVRRGGPEVNRLVLVNNSRRPLLLLAGEIVTGGKQDRVISKDRIVPPESDPIDLGVFCVEPGRWVGTSDRFAPAAVQGGAMGAAVMAAPSVRSKAMADKDQAKVWSEVRNNQAVMGGLVPGPAAGAVAETSSYARVMQNAEVQQKVNTVAEPIQRNYESLIRQLRDRNAVGVVVAVNGEIIWADIFASTNLLQRYWPKLIRSYAAEAVVTRAKGATLSTRAAQDFLADLEGRHETIESEPGIYRHTEVTGDGFKAFELTSLLPKTGFDVHIAKMAE
jgi:hypothetical protein